MEYEDMHLVFLLFTLSPDASTCDIAALARITCREVVSALFSRFTSTDSVVL